MVVKRCICQICVCGRHRCPHKPFSTKGHGPCSLSEYHEEYKRKHAPRPDNFKPAYAPMKHTGPISDKTTNRIDYIKHAGERPRPHLPDEYRKPDGDIDTMTSYKKEYTPKEGAPSKPIRRMDARKVQGRFEGDPTYKTDYRKWQLPEKKLYHDPNLYSKPEAAFEGEPTYKSDYHKHPFAMRQSLRPDEGGKPSDDPFDGRTGYRDDFIKHPLTARMPKEREPHRPPGAPLDDLTTHRLDYTPKDGGRAASFKPNNTAFMSKDPLSDNTTFRTDFKKWPVGRPAAFVPEQWQKPAGDMDLRTTTQIEFDKKPMDVVRGMKPEGRRPVTAAFDGTTTQKEDFRNWPMGDRARPTMKPDYCPPEAPFEGQSTFKAHYTPKEMDMQRSFKPDAQAMATGPFDGNTMYRTDYVPKESEPCPAAILDTGRSKYRYAEQKPDGHKFYQSQFESVTALPGTINGVHTQPKMSSVSFA